MQIITALLVLIPCFLFVSCADNTGSKAETILFNGNIYTVCEAVPRASAVAIYGGRIIGIGEMDDCARVRGSSTKMIDLKGAFVTPGLIEGHAHLMGAGYRKLDVDLQDAKTFTEVVRRVGDAAKMSSPGTWIRGGGWHQDKWTSGSDDFVDGFPTHHQLSLATPDNPVILSHASGHAILVNAAAMKLAGISRKTNFNKGGEIIRDASGDPTGVFVENATGLIGAVVPSRTSEEMEKAYRLAVRTCLSYGITSFHDAGVSKETIDLYMDQIQRGNAGIRIYAMLQGSDRQLMARFLKQGPLVGYGNDFLTVRAVKLFSDGALGSRGAWLLEPYEDMPDSYGHSTISLQMLDSMADEALAAGFQVCVHAIGDRANREVLNVYESVFARYPDLAGEARFRIEHAQHLHPDDIPRFERLGVLPAMQAIHLSSDRPWAIARLGQERIISGAYMWQALLQSGVKIINGTDAPVEPMDPMACFYAAVTRKTLAGLPEGGFEPDQRMTRHQALKSYTIDAAYGAFEEQIKGSLEVGKVADLVVFNKDLMTCPEEEILSARAVMTIVNGHILHAEPSF